MILFYTSYTLQSRWCLPSRLNIYCVSTDNSWSNSLFGLITRFIPTSLIERNRSRLASLNSICSNSGNIVALWRQPCSDLLWPYKANELKAWCRHTKNHRFNVSFLVVIFFCVFSSSILKIYTSFVYIKIVFFCQEWEKSIWNVPTRTYSSLKPTLPVCGKNVYTCSCSTNGVGLVDQSKHCREGKSTRISTFGNYLTKTGNLSLRYFPLGRRRAESSVDDEKYPDFR